MKAFMKLAVCSLVLLIGVHAQTRNTGKANTNKQCSPATTGDNNIYIFQYCGNDPQQERKILQLLNKVLQNQDAASSNARLDELITVASRPTQSQNNSGGVNVQQGTFGNDSPIINSPITIGDVPKTITPKDMQSLVTFLKKHKPTAKVEVLADQYSGASPFVDDFYDAMKSAGWNMQDPGVSRVSSLSAPGKLFQGVTISTKGEAYPPNELIHLESDDPRQPILTALRVFKLQPYLQRNQRPQDSVIEIFFQGGFASPR